MTVLVILLLIAALTMITFGLVAGHFNGNVTNPAMQRRAAARARRRSQRIRSTASGR